VREEHRVAKQTPADVAAEKKKIAEDKLAAAAKKLDGQRRKTEFVEASRRILEQFSNKSEELMAHIDVTIASLDGLITESPDDDGFVVIDTDTAGVMFQ
jgi:DNA integrity scanning protein DisA with diadenylate cyclase activity